MGLKIKIKIMDKDKDKVIGYLSNKREKRDTARQSSLQGGNSWAKVRKVGAGPSVPFKRSNAAGRKSLVYNTDLSARQDNSMANAKADYEGQRMEDKRNGAELYSVRCYDCY